MATRMSLYLDDGDVRVLHGDCIHVMRELAADSIDAIITDPPYGLEFMGKSWDSFKTTGNFAGGGIGDPERFAADKSSGRHGGGASPLAGRPRFGPTDNSAYQASCEAWAREAFRVLKPGGHIAAFGGTRTAHRLASGIEDAGFEIRDTLAWLYGSGFPKSLDVSKAIDKAAGAERELTGRKPKVGGMAATFGGGEYADHALDITAPATPDAERWQGWGTALKPAHEPITLARKPLAGTVSANVLQYGTGALHIDACRIGAADGDYAHPGNDLEAGAKGFGFGRTGQQVEPHAEGRWPANVILDAEAAALLDQQTGESASTIGKPRGAASGNGWGMTHTGSEYADRGGASRFFYTAKASGSERNDGLHDLPAQARKPYAGGMDGISDQRMDRLQERRPAANTHPTVKPVDLMRWLIRLLAPPHALILDPFAGSGTTGVAARLESVRCILIEREAEYLPIIAGRLSQQSLLS